MLSGLFFLVLGIAMTVGFFCYAANVRGVTTKKAQRNLERAQAVHQARGRLDAPTVLPPTATALGIRILGTIGSLLGLLMVLIACATLQQ
ncbi:hypothetical protein [Streptomyces sp. RPT161]|uniref:hypothetical protein n=1 Tax=Streptomyces sp. RPT161 TaxID=3015993 RepID=UPI0022B8ED16|nr:hypothetical protein [Streptomyces sp. RPT161]